jgi:hypothetical protein
MMSRSLSRLTWRSKMITLSTLAGIFDGRAATSLSSEDKLERFQVTERVLF